MPLHAVTIERPIVDDGIKKFSFGFRKRKSMTVENRDDRAFCRTFATRRPPGVRPSGCLLGTCPQHCRCLIGPEVDAVCSTFNTEQNLVDDAETFPLLSFAARHRSLLSVLSRPIAVFRP